MGGEGLAIAVAVVLILLYLAPALWQRRSVLNEVHSEEKYSAQLRLLHTVPTAAVNERHEYGTIFIRERKAMAEKPAPREKTRDLRAVARGRARARARIVRRSVYRSRAMLGGAALLGITLLAWVLLLVSVLSWAVPVICTVLSLGYGVALRHFQQVWGQETLKDQEIIARSDEILGAHGAPKARAQRSRSIAPARRRVPAGQKMARIAEARAQLSASTLSEQEVAESASLAGETLPAGVERTTEVSAKAAAPSRQYASRSRSEKAARTESGSAAKEQLAASSRSAAIAKPSYTLKGKGRALGQVGEPIQKRTVKPYEPSPVAEAAVPYRPQRPGERIGNAEVAAAHAAPEMSGSEESRLDLLGSGNTLDDLLARRRA